MEALSLPSLGARVRYYRTQCGLTQRGLERLCAIKHPHLSNIENDVVQPRVDVLERLAAALGICVNQLVPCKHPPPVGRALCPDD
jgi:predicted transcriptional regulator